VGGSGRGECLANGKVTVEEGFSPNGLTLELLRILSVARIEHRHGSHTCQLQGIAWEVTLRSDYPIPFGSPVGGKSKRACNDLSGQLPDGRQTGRDSIPFRGAG
jgi:hypothetical protein